MYHITPYIDLMMAQQAEEAPRKVRGHRRVDSTNAEMDGDPAQIGQKGIDVVVRDRG
jgi:hypothetical protein